MNEKFKLSLFAVTFFLMNVCPTFDVANKDIGPAV